MTMPSLAPSIQILTGCVTSVVALSIAVGAPLLRIGSVYDLHLFPRNDDIEYDTSETHRASQVTHCLAIGFFAIAMLLALGAVSVFANGSALQQRRVATLLAAFTSLGATAHIIALATLIKLAIDWKHRFERLPIPLPDVQVNFRAGLYADFMGYIITFGTATVALVAAARLCRHSYVQLE